MTHKEIMDKGAESFHKSIDMLKAAVEADTISSDKEKKDALEVLHLMHDMVETGQLLSAINIPESISLSGIIFNTLTIFVNAGPECLFNLHGMSTAYVIKLFHNTDGFKQAVEDLQGYAHNSKMTMQ